MSDHDPFLIEQGLNVILKSDLETVRAERDKFKQAFLEGSDMVVKLRADLEAAQSENEQLKRDAVANKNWFEGQIDSALKERGEWIGAIELTAERLAQARARISELEDQCIALGDKVLHMLQVVDAARAVIEEWDLNGVNRQGPHTSVFILSVKACRDALAALDVLPPAPQPRQPASTDSAAVPDVQPISPA